jgi:diguanylate cyclase (GGDEF)-like protein
MLAPAQPANERQRLATLRSLQILDTPAEERFDRLTRLARRLFDVPIALVSLVDGNRQWFKSCSGLGVSETARDVSFCGHTILNDQILMIPDAGSDERFADNPLVTGAPGIRFYAGCPLKVADGSNVGTLCLIDTRPRTLDAEERELFRDLASMAEQEIDAVQMATLDHLTEVANRRGFETLASHSLNICKRMDTAASLLFFDLDGFKGINDTYGHGEGDRALQTFAQVLRTVVREMDTVGRLGGDEFGALLMGSGEPESRAIVERFREALTARTRRDKRAYAIGYSVGIVEYDPARHGTVRALLNDADAAMYLQKVAARKQR